MTDNVIPIGCVTRLDMPADRVLERAIGALDGVAICGWTKDGEIYCASSIADGSEVLWLLENMKRMLLDPEG